MQNHDELFPIWWYLINQWLSLNVFTLKVVRKMIQFRFLLSIVLFFILSFTKIAFLK